MLPCLQTLAFLLPALTAEVAQPEGLRARRGPHTVVASPSRALCIQIVGVVRSLLPGSAGQRVQQVIGGANPKRQAASLRASRPGLVVGTPSRLAQLVESRQLDLSSTQLVVLDEVRQTATPGQCD